MSRPGTCETGCAEHKLVLVRAAALDALASAEATILANTAALSGPAEPLVERPPPAKTLQTILASIQQEARAALQRAPDDARLTRVLSEPAEPAITWWCDRCGGVDAPQPCLGICIWRTVEWARHDTYADARERVLAERETEQRLRALLRRLTHTTPHPGQYEAAWRAFAAEAAGACDPRHRSPVGHARGLAG